MLATLPMFLFSTTFYPLSVYPRALQIIVECTPLYQASVLLRGLTLGVVNPGLLWSIAYLTLIGAFGLAIAAAGSAGSCSSNACGFSGVADGEPRRLVAAGTGAAGWPERGSG